MVDSVGLAVPRVLALIPAGLALVLYVITCSPTVNFTDSGELITVAWTGGIAHPPGYPLYTLLSILWVHLPLGDSPAWRLNLLSAVFGAVAVGLFYGLVTDSLAGMATFHRLATPGGGVAVRKINDPSRGHEQTARKPARSGVPASSSPTKAGARPAVPRGVEQRATISAPRSDTPAQTRVVPQAATAADPAVSWAAATGGLAAAGLLAVSLTFWNWATQAKFYGLHYIFVVALLWLALRIRRAFTAEIASNSPSASPWSLATWSPTIRLLHLLALMIGLALTNHYLTFLVLPGVVTLILAPPRGWRAVLQRLARHAVTLLVAALLPLLLYLYLPIRAGMHPLLAWGLPDTWGDFWRQVTAQSYQGLFSTTNLGTHVVDAFVYLANQFGPWLGLVLLALIGIGLGQLWRLDRALLAAMIITAGVHLLVVLNYNIREIPTYYVPVYMIHYICSFRSERLGGQERS